MIKAYLIPPAFRLGKVPGQVPSKGRMRTLGQVQALSRMGARSGEGATNLTLGKLAGRPKRAATQGKDPFAMPGNLTEERLLAQDDPMLSPSSVVRNMGLDVTETATWTKFLEQTTSSANEAVFRKAVMEKLLESGWEGQMRKAVLARALTYWRTVQKVKLKKAAQADMFTVTEPAKKPEELPPAAKRTSSQQFYLGPRGGKWADVEHTIPWGGESGGLTGQQTLLSPVAKDVTRKEHESPVLKNIITRQGRAFSSYVKAATAARDQGDAKAETRAWAQAEKAARNVQAALVEMGKPEEAEDWDNYAKKAAHRKTVAFDKTKTKPGYYTYSEMHHRARALAEKALRYVLTDEGLQKALFIGPRGGKWADAKHTIPWKPPAGKKVHVVDMTGGDSLEAQAEPEVAPVKEKPAPELTIPEKPEKPEALEPGGKEWEERYVKPRRDAEARVKKTIAVGKEYGNERGEQFGAVLKEVAGELPYRVQWYDKRGLSGHSEVASLDAAAKLLIDDLGDGIQQAPGSFDKLAVLTPSRVLPSDWERVPKGEFKPEAVQAGQQVAVRVSWGAIQKYERLASGEFQKVDDPETTLTPEEFTRQVEVYRAQVAVQPEPKPKFEIKREPVTITGVWEEGENPELDITIPEKVKPKWAQHSKQKQTHLPEDPERMVQSVESGGMIRRHAEGGQHASVLMKVAPNQWARFYSSGRRELGNKIYTDEWAASQVETADEISIVPAPAKPKPKPAETFTIPEKPEEPVQAEKPTQKDLFRSEEKAMPETAQILTPDEVLQKADRRGPKQRFVDFYIQRAREREGKAGAGHLLTQAEVRVRAREELLQKAEEVPADVQERWRKMKYDKNRGMVRITMDARDQEGSLQNLL